MCGAMEKIDKLKNIFKKLMQRKTENILTKERGNRQNNGKCKEQKRKKPENDFYEGIIHTKDFVRLRRKRTSKTLFKVNNRNTRKRSETCLKLTIKTPKRGP